MDPYPPQQPPDPAHHNPYRTPPGGVPGHPSGPQWREQPAGAGAPPEYPAAPYPAATPAAPITGPQPAGYAPGTPDAPPPAGWPPARSGSRAAIAAILVVSAVAVAAIIVSVVLGFRLSDVSASLQDAQDRNSTLEEERDAAIEAERVVEDELADADLPALLDDVETLDAQFWLEVLFYEEDASDEEAAAVVTIMYDCLNAREEYNTAAASYADHLPEDLPELLADDDYDCGRSFWETPSAPA